MPQIWLSYEEAGDYLGFGASATAGHIIAERWPRRNCSDGVNRFKLPAGEHEKFLQFYSLSINSENNTDMAVATLRSALRAGRDGENRKAVPPQRASRRFITR